MNLQGKTGAELAAIVAELRARGDALDAEGRAIPSRHASARAHKRGEGAGMHRAADVLAAAIGLEGAAQ